MTTTGPNNKEPNLKAPDAPADKPGQSGFVVEQPLMPAELKGPKVPTGPGCLIRLFSLTGLILVICLILAFLAGLKYSVLFLAPEETSREIVVSIPEGASTARIGQVLQEAGVVKSGEAFVWAVKAKSRLKGPVNLKAGEMALDPSLPIWKTIDLVAKGNYKLYPFTIPEGRNIYEVAQMLESGGLASQAEFLALCRDQAFIKSLGLEGETLEGFLFPETYSFPKGTPVKNIVKTMTDAFQKVWGKYAAMAQQQGLSQHQVVTLASIVEKETGAATERPIIAGVFTNRLAKGMKLQTDPTVIYGLLPGFNGNITKNDLQNPHPYNTYVYAGLPPGPIANPGEAALAAVVKPDIVPYLYFVSKNDGTHQFSETLADHNRAVNRYQKQAQTGGASGAPKSRKN